MPAHIARQPGMGRRMDHPGADAVADREPGRALGLALGRSAAVQHRRDAVGRQRPRHRLGRMQRLAGLDLVCGDQAAFQHQPFEAREPDLVIALAQILLGRPVLAGKARHVDVPAAGHSHRQRDREGAPLPFGVKHRLVRLGLHRTGPRDAAHVVRAVHQATSCGCFGKPVPIMLSRVTRSASRSSLQPSVPAGRIGSTR